MDSYSSHAEGVQQVQAGWTGAASERNVKNDLKKKAGSKVRKYADDTKLFRPVGQGQAVKYYKVWVTGQ